MTLIAGKSHTMKAWIRSSFLLGSATLFVSACVLVEDFEGYGPREDVEVCETKFCPSSTSSGFGGSGSGSSGLGGETSITTGSGSTSSSSSSGTPSCVMIPCAGEPCPPVEVVADSQLGMLTTDAESFFIATSTAPTNIIRVAKPSCSVPVFEQPAVYPSPDHSVVSDGKYAAWIVNDFSGACLSPTLRFCDPSNCVPQDVQAAIWPDQGEFTRLDLGPDYLYFTMRNGLAGRLLKGSTQPEMLWIDPEGTAALQAFLQYSTVADGKFFASRAWLADKMSICSSFPTGVTGAIWSSDAAPNSTPTKIASDISFVGGIAAGSTYLYFHLFDGMSILNRIPKAGGAIESLMASGKIVASSDLQNFVIKGGRLYFRVGIAGGEHAVVRLPIDTDKWSTDALEILVQAPSFRTFAVDDVAIYTDECVDVGTCSKYHIMARRLP